MKLTIPFILLLLFMGCQNGKTNNYENTSVIQSEADSIDVTTHPGKKLMEINCYVCHSPTTNQGDRVGPPMIAIKKHYISDDTTKEEFIKNIQDWIKNPNENDAKMFGAVRRFGVMPKTLYPEETIAQIADYVFDNDIEQPEWFEDHFNEEKGKHKGEGKGMGNGKRKQMHKQQAQINFDELPYAERGLKYALSTKAVLGKNLMGTIQKKGTLEALAFCNEQAYPLTDSMSVVHNVTIKRVSDKPRNPNNQANTEELEYIENFKDVIANQQEPTPVVKESNSKVKVYYPITTNTMCLQCHGKPTKNIEPKTLKALTLLYPNDQATGYDVSQVRGIWTITFEK